MCFGPFRVLRPLCHWGPFITIFLVTFISITTIVSHLDVFPPTRENPIWLIHFVLMTFWPFLIFYNYFQAVFLGPGYVPLGWVPPKEEHKSRLQFCIYCQGYKAPRSHHCRQCNRCVMKMDHHCPWINTCTGHFNQTRFIYFLMMTPVGCMHGAVVLSVTAYIKISKVLDAVNNPYLRGPRPEDVSLSHLIATFLAIGASIGVSLSVSFLLYVQMKVAFRNETGIENWIVTKARSRDRKEPFIYPYNLGWKENLRQVFTWEGQAKGNGFVWPVAKGCNQFTLTVEQIIQKRYKKQRMVEHVIVENYSGSWFPVTKGICTCLRVPISEEPRIRLCKGDRIMVTRWKSYWLYGDKILLDEDEKKALKRVRGWFPRRCAREQLSDDEESEDEISDDTAKKNY